MAAGYKARTVALPTTSGWTNPMPGMAPFIGTRVPPGQTQERNSHNYRGESCTQVQDNQWQPTTTSNPHQTMNKINSHWSQQWSTTIEPLWVIGIAFSAKTQEFFTGIKMHLVAKTPTLTNPKACHKAKQLQALQAHFLAQSDTCLLWVTPLWDYNKQHTSNGITLEVLAAQSLDNQTRIPIVLCS